MYIAELIGIVVIIATMGAVLESICYRIEQSKK